MSSAESPDPCKANLNVGDLLIVDLPDGTWSYAFWAGHDLAITDDGRPLAVGEVTRLTRLHTVTRIYAFRCAAR